MILPIEIDGSAARSVLIPADVISQVSPDVAEQVTEYFNGCLQEAVSQLQAQLTGAEMAAVQTDAYLKAAAAMSMFLDRPGSITAADALVAVSLYGGPRGPFGSPARHAAHKAHHHGAGALPFKKP